MVAEASSGLSQLLSLVTVPFLFREWIRWVNGETAALFDRHDTLLTVARQMNGLQALPQWQEALHHPKYVYSRLSKAQS